MRKADSQPIMIMADMYLIEERFIGSVDRGLHEIARPIPARP